jgi:hypothetical protein
MSWISRCIPALVVAIGPAMLLPLRAAPVVDCPALVRVQIDGLYRWRLEEQQQAMATAIATQRQRFTPQLYALVERATSLTPADGRFIDFDVFSGTQVTTFGASVLGCRQLQTDAVEALVAVQAGLRGRTAEPPQQLRFLLRQASAQGWRIDDITYPTTPPFRLRIYLQELVGGQR